MNPRLERFAAILQTSLITFIDESERAPLLSQSQLIEVEKGLRIPRADKPQDLLILLSGESSVRMRHGVEVGRLMPGRSFELRALMLHEAQWNYDWFAEESSIILSIPWSAFEAALAKNEKHYQYLGRISQSVVIQRLRRDMAALGVSRPTVIEVISSLHLETAENLFSDWNRQVFCTIYQGELKTVLKYGRQPLLLGAIQAGDSGLLNLKSSLFSYEATDDLRAWALFEGEWTKFAGRDEFERYLEVFSNAKRIDTLVSGDLGNRLQFRDRSDARSQSLNMPSGGVRKRAQGRPFSGLTKWFWQRRYSQSVFSSKNEATATIATLVTVGRIYGYGFGPEAISFASGGVILGQSLEALRAAATQAGFQVQVLPIDRVAELMVEAPVILECGSGLKIILRKLADEVLVFDPSSGKLGWRSAHEVQNTLLEDRMIVLQPSDQLEKLRNPRVPYEKIGRMIFDKPRLVGLFAMASVISYFSDLTLPVLNQYLFDVVVGQAQIEPFLPVIGAMLILTIFSNRVGIFRQKLSVDMSTGLSLKLKGLYQNKILRMRPMHVQALGASSGLTRSLELEEVGSFFVDGVLASLLSLGLMVGALFVLWLYHESLAVLALVFTPIEIFMVRLLKPKVERYRLESHLLRAQENRMMVEHFAGREDLKSLKAQLTAVWKWQSSANMGSANLRHSGVLQGFFEVISFLFGEIVRISCFIAAVRLYLQGSMSLGQVLGTSMLVGKVSAPIKGLVSTYFRFFSVRPILLKLSEVINAPVEFDRISKRRSSQKLLGRIQFKNVRFGYPSDFRGKILRDLSFDIEQGQKIAIVGRSGSGKTTLAMLLNGLKSPTSGDILIDGRSIREMDLGAVRDQIALVEQEGSLFAGPIINNIAQGDETPDVERAQWAARMAEIEEEILARPGGFSSPLMHGGTGLSEGQRQRLLIARALYRDPSVLVLDEATSHLDPISEERIVSRVMSEYRRRTVIFCTQRVHLAQRADRVFYIESGKLREFGTHHELIERRDRYYRFFVAHLSLG